MILKKSLLLLLGVFAVGCTHMEPPDTSAIERSPQAWIDEHDEMDAANEALIEQPFEEQSISRVLSPSVFDWPVDEARMTRGFSLKPTGRRRRPHFGIDLAFNKGTPIYASQSGKIVYAGRDFRGYGNFVLIENEKGWASLYAHLSKIRVKMGQIVERGFRIGDMGRTGRATGVHLHFEIRKDRSPVDPLNFLPTTKVAIR